MITRANVYSEIAAGMRTQGYVEYHNGRVPPYCNAAMLGPYSTGPSINEVVAGLPSAEISAAQALAIARKAIRIGSSVRKGITGMHGSYGRDDDGTDISDRWVSSQTVGFFRYADGYCIYSNLDGVLPDNLIGANQDIVLSWYRAFCAKLGAVAANSLSVSYQIDMRICHSSSCHSSCHGSRGRR